VPSHVSDVFDAEAFPEASIEQIVARYDTLIRVADRQLGRLVDRASARTNPDGLLSIVTADHGEAFLDHGWRSHGVQIYEESVRIPLVIHWPQRIRPAVIEGPVSLLDIVPTLLGLLGIREANHDWAGRNLANVLGPGRDDGVAQPVIFQRQTYEHDGLVEPIPLRDIGGKTFGGSVEVQGEMFAIRDGRWKYIEALEEPLSRQLYDIEEDPRESRNLADEEPQLVQNLSQRLANWRLQHAVPTASKFPGVTAADRERLRALGYVDPVPAQPESP
jgi:arylsulfatase A-like enzyme